jgi:hypothetical protein
MGQKGLVLDSHASDPTDIHTMNEQSRDISELAAGAHREMLGQQKPPPEKKPFLGHRARATLAVVVAGLAVAATYGFAGPYLLGYSDHTLRKELRAVVETARQEVEKARGKQGRLPDSLPSMALAMIVEYHRTGDGYRLIASDGERIVEMDSSGSVSESRVSR